MIDHALYEVHNFKETLVTFAAMSVLVQITIKPAQQKDTDFILKSSLFKAKLRSADISDWRIRKRSIDARKASIKLNLQIEFWLLGETRTQPQSFMPQEVHSKPESLS